jgi:hypothetical protein
MHHRPVDDPAKAEGVPPLPDMDRHARKRIPGSVDDPNLQICLPQLVNTLVGLLTPRLVALLDLVNDSFDALDVVS